MGWLWNLLRVRFEFDLTIAVPISDVVQRMQLHVLPARPPSFSKWEGYVGKVTDRGFTVRRFGRPLSHDESRPAVSIRGEFWPERDQTRVTVMIRHGRLLVTFAWLVLLLGLAVLAGPAAAEKGRPGGASPTVWDAVLPAIGALFYLGLWRDMRRVRREVLALLTDPMMNGSQGK
jgi:hypothetical protein